MKKTVLKWMAIFLVLFGLTACVTPPPKKTDNICSIFRQYPTWYWDTQKAQKRWGVPISTTMAIIHQESSFNGRAQPPRKKLLGIIPWFRPTSSYGYAQAVQNTWRHYQKDTGRSSATRDAFDDAADFIGWYATQANKRLGISKSDTYSVYLAYHEGMGGFAKKTYLKKKWLLAVASKVRRRANTYHSQLLACKSSLPQKPWYRFW